MDSRVAEQLLHDRVQVLAVVLGPHHAPEPTHRPFADGREDIRAVLEVKLVDVLGGKERAALGVGHGGHQASGARPCDHVEVVRDPCVRPIKLLELLFEESEDGAWNDPSDTAAVDAQNGDDAPVAWLRGGGR